MSAERTIPVSIRGVWVHVPAFDIDDHTIVVTGRWLKIAFIDGEDLGKELRNPEACLQAMRSARSSRPRIDIFTFSQEIPVRGPRFNYPTEWDSIAVVGSSSFKAWWEHVPQETRKNVRRSQKRGVEIVVKPLDDDLVHQICGVNNASAVRQNKEFVHYGKTFDQVKYDQSTYLDRSDFLCAYSGDELIGFLKIVYNGAIASIVQLLTKHSHSDSRPANALLSKAIELCETKGALYLTYGKYNYGNKTASSLLDFKRRNGFEEFLMPRYYVPLTPWGAVCMRLRAHHGLIGMLPKPLISVSLRVRSGLFGWKRSISRCSSVAERPNSNRQAERAIPPAGSTFVPTSGDLALAGQKRSGSVSQPEEALREPAAKRFQ